MVEAVPKVLTKSGEMMVVIVTEMIIVETIRMA